MRCLISLFLLINNFSFADPSFSYDLHLSHIPGKEPGVMITAHGMGANYQIAEAVLTDKTVVTFNFPDYDLYERALPFSQTTFGTFNEIAPLLHVINKCVKDGHQIVELYGFSAGGGAIINALGALNTTRFNPQLASLGITQNEKQKMLEAIQKGVVILDVSLKSIREIVDYRGKTPDLAIALMRYTQNDMEPLDSMKYLEGLSLHFIVHFQTPDEVLSNRDDQLFYSRLKAYNSLGKTDLVLGYDGGHMGFHTSLWNFYRDSSRANISSATLSK